LANFLKNLHAIALKVVDVRYFETAKGTGYECATNYAGITIWNDGTGGETYIDPPKAYKLLDIETGFTSDACELLINEFERVKPQDEPKGCPSCMKIYYGYPALSRKDNKTEICSDCGTAEALAEFSKHKSNEEK
tara:strand:- start:40 stop:444 length:405 start_codon:yes stop_codon:yes gene_type:complete